MITVSKVTTGLFALPHLVLLLRNNEKPSIAYMVLLAVSLVVIFGYTRMFEMSGETSMNKNIATGLLPLVMTLAVMTNAVLYSINDESSGSEGPTGDKLLGVVRQYRLSDVIDRFRSMVTNRHTESHEQGFN